MSGLDGFPRLHVQPEKCSSCIFGPNSPVSPERFADLRAQWERRGNEKFQICHQVAVGNTDDEGNWDEEEEDLSIEAVSVCRGWYDEMYLKRGVASQIVQVAERLGLLDTEGEMRGG